MSNLPAATPHSTCPFLGMKHDETTSLAYPSYANHCYHCKHPFSPIEEHQEKFCLTSGYEECQIFAREGNISFPEDLIWRIKKSRSIFGYEISIPGIVLLFIAVVILSYFVSVKYFQSAPQRISATPSPEAAEIPTTDPVAMVTEGIIPLTGKSPTNSPVPLSETPVFPTRTDPVPQQITSRSSFSAETTSSPMQKLTITQKQNPGKTQVTRTGGMINLSPHITIALKLTQTPTKRPTITQTPRNHRLEMPILVDGNTFILHMVKSGESTELLADTFGTTTEILSAINFDLIKHALWEKSIIVISPGLIVDDPNIPSFQTYQILKEYSSIESLAKELKTDLELLEKYNNCQSNCNLEIGDWILIPHKR
jgi:hypothetical protein